MRIIHTSDWHLGQSFHNYDRGYEHQCFLDWLLDQIETESADALLIAGDVFDNANPSAASLKQFYRFLLDARGRVPHLNVVVIAGNHDSPGRLEAPAPLLSAIDATVVGQVGRDDTGGIDVRRLVVPLKDRTGRIRAWCLAVPFLRPGDVPRVEDVEDAYLAGIGEVYRHAAEHAMKLLRQDQALLAMGHCHMAGGHVSERSERRIVIGGAEMLDCRLFGARIAYVALGHLHLAQRVGGTEHIRYSGSPLPMSFSEVRYPHQVVLFELDGPSVARIEPVAIPRFVDLLQLPEQPAPLAEAIAAFEQLPSEKMPEERHPYLQVRVRLEGPEPGLRSRLEAALSGKPVRLARIDPVYSSRAGVAIDSDEPSEGDGLHGLRPEDIFQGLYSSRYGSDAPGEMMSLFRELLIDPGAGTEA
ncbi:MAG: exonuclease SbcCD subunit D C-terminal domain-containing protein [Methylotetracoccus sp.]|nr:exonuclease SbcCD subunit D C-terminal domain-containing protein [Methylotetracoccus sp.]